MMIFFREHASFFILISVISAALFIASLILIPLILVRLPEDYFETSSSLSQSKTKRTKRGWLFWMIRNAVGIVLLFAGLAMLVLPGQGLLTILIGLMIAEFPGKEKWKRKFLGMKGVLKGINYIRARAGKRPIKSRNPS